MIFYQPYWPYQSFAFRDQPLTLPGTYGDLKKQTLEEMLPDFSGKEVLDLGCGFGFSAKILSPVAKSVVGIDVDARSGRLFERLCRNNSNCRFLLQNIFKEGPTSTQYDVAVAFTMIHWVCDLDNGMSLPKSARKSLTVPQFFRIVNACIREFLVFDYVSYKKLYRERMENAIRESYHDFTVLREFQQNGYTGVIYKAIL